jgi:hypothetical protein
MSTPWQGFWQSLSFLLAYAWPEDIGDDEALERLLALNRKRSAAQGAESGVADERGDEGD